MCSGSFVHSNLLHCYVTTLTHGGRRSESSTSALLIPERTRALNEAGKGSDDVVDDVSNAQCAEERCSSARTL